MKIMEKVKIYYSNGQAYVWKSDDCYRLRANHRIIGQFCGTIASLPRQEILRGLPLTLLPEEVALLIQKDLAVLIRSDEVSDELTAEVQEHYKILSKKIFDDQNLLMHEKRKQEIANTVDIIIAGKKKKLAAQGITSDAIDRQELADAELNKLKPLTKEHSLVELSTANPLPPTGSEEIISVDKLIGYCPVKVKIFADLWKKGHYITQGDNFGGDYLIYDGDPVQNHATQVINIRDYKTPFRLREMVIHGRVATNTQKLATFASINNEGKVIYETLSWKGC